MVDFESPDLRKLTAELDAAGGIAAKDSRAVVSKGLLNIKKDSARRVTGLAHAPAYPRSITYDVTQAAACAWGEVGPDKDRRQGALGNILEYGTVKNPPRPHMGPAGDAEEPRFVRAMQDLAVKASGLE
jgi:hypothetical protein